MKPFLPAAGVVAAFLSAGIHTDYTADRALVLVAHTSLEMETTASTMEVDGEPVDRGGFGGGASLEERTVEQTFKVLAHADGAPTKVRRAFGTVTRSTTTEMGEQSVEGGGDGPLHDVTLEIALEDGELHTEVVDGSEPEQESALQGHALTLAFDGLLPAGDVEEDAQWDLEGPAILRALGLDLEDAYFPLEEQADSGASGGESGGRGRGGRGFRGARGSSLRGLIACEWKGEATFKGDAEHDGVACVEIALSFEASGELPEVSGFGGAGRRGRAFGLALGRSAVNENSISAKLEGRLLFAKDGGYPVLFEVEGTLSTVRHNEFDRGESTMTIHTEQEGTLEYRVEVATETDDE